MIFVFNIAKSKLPKKFTIKIIIFDNNSVIHIKEKFNALGEKLIKDTKTDKKEESIKIGIRGKTKILGTKEITENSPIKKIIKGVIVN